MLTRCEYSILIASYETLWAPNPERKIDRPTDGTIGVEFDESSLLNGKPDSPARGWLAWCLMRVRKMTGREKEILYRRNSNVNPYPLFPLIPLSSGTWS